MHERECLFRAAVLKLRLKKAYMIINVNILDDYV